MDSSSAATFHGFPWDWTIKGVIDLEHPWTVTVAPETTLISTRQTLTCDTQQLAGGYIKQNSAGRGQSINGLDLNTGDDFTPQRAKVSSECVSELLRAPKRHWPPNGMSKDAQGQTKCRAWRLMKTQHRVRTQPGEKRTSTLFLKRALRKSLGRTNGLQAETDEHEGMRHRLQSEWAEKGVREGIPVGNEWCHELLICLCIAPKSRTRLLH
jgi:hypothetical protein